MDKRISFIICSYGAPASLLKTIDSVLEQNNVSSAEIVLVNNGFSSQREKDIRERLEAGQVDFKLVRESTPGLGFARRAGFRAASGTYFILLDDDNYLERHFIDELLLIIDKGLNIGGICPIVEPHWEVVPEKWLQDFGRYCLSYNATADYRPPYEEKYWPPNEANEYLRPPGGGMIIHAAVATHYLNTVQSTERISLSRKPDSLIGCEDQDIFSGVSALGLGVYYAPKLIVYHMIPAKRTTHAYLMRLNFQMLYSYGILETMKKGPPRDTVVWRQFLREVNMAVRSLLLRNYCTQRFFYEIVRSVGFALGRHIQCK